MDRKQRADLANKGGEASQGRVAGDETIRQARTRLSGTSQIHPEFSYELLAIFARNEVNAAVTIWSLTVIFAAASMFWAPWPESCAWLVGVIAAKVVLVELCRRFLATPNAEAELPLWHRRLFLAELLCGSTWAGLALIGAGSNEPVNATGLFSSHVFIFAGLIVLLAMRITFATTVSSILSAGTVPMTLAVVLRLCLIGEPFYYALAAMAVCVHAYFAFLSKSLRQTKLQMLEFRAQKDLLIAELLEAKHIAEEARSRAEAGSVAKSRFLATMSHELRTPLNAILGFSEVMKDEIFGSHAVPTYREYSKDIHESGRHLLHLINEILDLSRIEAGRYELKEERSHVGDIAEDCLRLLKLKAQTKGLDYIIDIDPALSQAWVDPRAMRQICLNLLSNALKFTPTGGRITLSVTSTEDGGQMLSIRDTGPGIPEDEIPKVMQAFGQGSLAHETAEGGTGLGLPIVKNLAELHGGSFELKSELRRGTEVIVKIPPERVLASVAPLQPLGEERHKQQKVPPAPRQPRLRQPLRPAASTGAGASPVAGLR